MGCFMNCQSKTIWGHSSIAFFPLMLVLLGAGLVTACAERFLIPWSDEESGQSPPQEAASPPAPSRPAPPPEERPRQSIEKPQISRKPPTEIIPPLAKSQPRRSQKSQSVVALPPVAPPSLTPRLSPPQNQTTPGFPNAGEEIRVALLLPLSGPHAALGMSMLRAAQMAIFDIADTRLTLLPYDTAGQPGPARQAAQAALADGVQLILGPVFSAAVRAVGEEVSSSQINVLAFSTDRVVGGDGVYLLGFVPRDEVNRVVSYALSQNYQRIAALVPNSPYGLRVAGTLEALVPKLGGTVTRVMRYDPLSDDYASLVRQFADYDRRRAALRERKDELSAQLSVQDDDATRSALKALETRETLGDLPFDAVLLPEGGARLRELAPLLAFYDVDPKIVRFLGTAQWDDASLGSEPALVGGWYAAAPPEKRADFSKRFKMLFGQSPPNLSDIAYDAVALAAVLARRNGDYSTASLTAPHGFAGVDGIFRLRADGLVQRGLAVLEVRREKPKVKSPAPHSFSESR